MRSIEVSPWLSYNDSGIVCLRFRRNYNKTKYHLSSTRFIHKTPQTFNEANTQNRGEIEQKLSIIRLRYHWRTRSLIQGVQRNQRSKIIFVETSIGCTSFISSYAYTQLTHKHELCSSVSVLHRIQSSHRSTYMYYFCFDRICLGDLIQTIHTRTQIPFVVVFVQCHSMHSFD